MDLEFRINLLVEAQLLPANEAGKIIDMIALFSSKWQVELDEENASMFITHFAMMLKRLRDTESLAALDAAIISEIESSAAYPASRQAMQAIEQLCGMTFPDSEKGYIYLHLNKYFE